MKCKTKGYLVEFLVFETGLYAAYTHPQKPVSRGMAEALGRGLKRQGQPGRIVTLPDRALVETWTGREEN